MERLLKRCNIRGLFLLVLISLLTISCSEGADQSDRDIISSHLVGDMADREAVGLTWLMVESIAYQDAMTGNRDREIEEYREFLNSDMAFALPIDDVCFVEQEDIPNIEGMYSAILVFSEDEIAGYSKMEEEGRRTMFRGVAPRGLYEDAMVLGVDVKVFYLARSLYNLTVLSPQSMCGALHDGISWTYREEGSDPHSDVIEVNPVYQPVIEDMAVECDDWMFSWDMNGPEGMQRYCAEQLQGSVIDVLFESQAYSEPADLEAALEEIKCEEEVPVT